MNNSKSSQVEFGEILQAKDQRIRELERRLTEMEVNLQAVVSQQIDAVLTSADTVPLLLSEAQQALQRSHEDLEQRVAERTAALEQANIALKQELEERNRAENRFRTVWDIALNAMALSDPQGKVIAANPAYCQLYGFSPQELIGQDFAVIYPEDKRAWARQGYQEAFNNPEIPPVFEATIQRKDGQLRTVESRITFLNQDNQRVAMLSIIRDITERRQAEEELQRSEASLRASNERIYQILENMNDGFFSFDQEWRMTYVNHCAAEQGMQTQEELIGKVIWEAQPRLAGTHLEMIYRRVMQERKPETAQYYVERSGRWYELRVQPWTDGISVYSMDITDRKRAEEAIRESENRFRTMSDGTPVMIWVHDVAGSIEFINRAYSEFFGVTLEQVHSDGWAPLVHSEDVPGYVDVFVQCSREHKAFRAQARVHRKDGQWRWIDSHGQPRFSEDGEFLGMVGSSLDITERVQAEQALRENEERFRVALSGLPMTVYILDRDLRYTWIYNPRLGMNNQQILGKRDDEMFPGDTSAEMIAVKQSVIDTGQRVMREITVNINGESKVYLLSLEPLRNASGNVIGLIGASLDVTEQRRIESERHFALTQMEIQRQLLENREKERQEIAHDLHDGPIQLLSGTLFNLQMTKEMVQDRSLNLELDQVTLNLKAAVRELREVVNELRPPSVIRFGFSKAAGMHAEDFQEKHPEIKIDLQCFEDGGLLPETVRLALFRIYQESLNNIVKHANAGQVIVKFFTEDRHVHLQIQDNGQGFQVPDDLIEQAQHGHYGLAGMKERAEAVGGEIQVISSPGKGSTIRLTIPINKE